MAIVTGIHIILKNDICNTVKVRAFCHMTFVTICLLKVDRQAQWVYTYNCSERQICLSKLKHKYEKESAENGFFQQAW